MDVHAKNPCTLIRVLDTDKGPSIEKEPLAEVPHAGWLSTFFLGGGL